MRGIQSRGVLLGLLLVIGTSACADPLASAVVDNQTQRVYYARVGGVADDRAQARVIELPSGARTSLERHVGLSDLLLEDVTILDADCGEVGRWEREDTFFDGPPTFQGAIVIHPDGRVTRAEDDSGPAGTDAFPSNACPPGPDILP